MKNLGFMFEINICPDGCARIVARECVCMYVYVLCVFVGACVCVCMDVLFVCRHVCACMCACECERVYICLCVRVAV